MSERNSKILRKFLKEMSSLSEGDQRALRRSISGPHRASVRKNLVDHFISIGKLDKIKARRERGQMRKNAR